MERELNFEPLLFFQCLRAAVNGDVDGVTVRMPPAIRSTTSPVVSLISLKRICHFFTTCPTDLVFIETVYIISRSMLHLHIYAGK